jgi:hypothetical protein
MRMPRSTRGAFRRRSEGADRGRWSRQGATRTPASRQPKLHGPGPPAADHGALGGCARRRYPSPACSQGPLAVDRRPGASRGRVKGQSTGGRAEQASNTACGTPEKWRTCGSRQPDGASSKSIVRLRLARGSGPWVRQDPGVPRRPHGAATSSAQPARYFKRAAERWLITLALERDRRLWRQTIIAAQRRGGIFGRCT